MFRLRAGLRKIQRPRIAACGWACVSEFVSVVANQEGRARWVGVVHCGSVWECPTCQLAICARRAAELTSMVERHGHRRAALLSLTVRHGLGDDLRILRRRLAAAWRGMCNGEPWKRWKARAGVIGSVRALEVTHGPNGWHPHLHVLMLLGAGAKEDARGEWDAVDREWLVERWAEMVGRHVGPQFVPDKLHGLRATLCHKAEYLAKLGLELSDPGHKGGRSENRTPLEIASDFCTSGREKDRQLWRRYCEMMKGARRLTWSAGLKASFGLRDFGDNELADSEQPEPTDVILARVSRFAWGVLRALKKADGVPWAAWVLEQAESYGAAACRAAVLEAVCG